MCPEDQKKIVLAEIPNLKSPKSVLYALFQNEETKSRESVPFAENTSRLRHPKIKRHVVLNALINCAGKTLQLNNEDGSLICVGIVGKNAQTLRHKLGVDFALLNALTNIILEKIISTGKEISQKDRGDFIAQENGIVYAILSGNEIEQFAKDAEENISIIQNHFRFITLGAGETFQDLGSILKMLCCSVLNVIDSFIPGGIVSKNTYGVNIIYQNNWLDVYPPLSDSAKYKMVGNGVALPVVEWIARRIAAHEKELEE